MPSASLKNQDMAYKNSMPEIRFTGSQKNITELCGQRITPVTGIVIYRKRNLKGFYSSSSSSFQLVREGV